QNASVAIERAEDRNNWTFEPKDKPQEESDGEPWQIAVSEIGINESKLAYRDAPLELSIDASITTAGDTVALSQNDGRDGAQPMADGDKPSKDDGTPAKTAA